MNKIDSMIADHLADAMAIERLAYVLFKRASCMGDLIPSWRGLSSDSREFWLRRAKRETLEWFNNENGTDFKIED